MTHLSPALQAAQDAARKKGQFGEQSHAHPGSNLLGDRPSYETIGIPMHSKYTTKVLPSPRHRKLVDVPHEYDMDGQLRSITADQAPLVMEFSSGGGTTCPVRDFDGDLYWGGSSKMTDPGSFGWVQCWADMEHPKSFTDEAEAREVKQDELDQFLVIDGHVWVKTVEPVYRVQNWGRGDEVSTTLSAVNFYNDGVPAGHHFRADQWEHARDFACNLAEQRGDTASVELIRNAGPSITVHNPAAVTATIPLPLGTHRATWRNRV